MRRLELRFLTLVVFLGRGALLAQNETSTQFNLSTPGARSLAMGQAFLGLADDATAAYTNPAGLTNLTVGGSEVAVELRGWDYSTRYLAGGNIGGSSRGVGLDTFEGIQTEESSSRTGGLSFLSVGYVLPGGITVAVFRQQLARFRSDYTSQGLFFITSDDDVLADCIYPRDLEDPDAPITNLCRTPPTRLQNEVQVDNTGFSAAYELPAFKGSLSLGLGLSYHQMERYSRAESFFFFEPTGNEFVDRSPRGFFGPAELLNDNVLFSDVVRDRDSAFGVNAGFLWKIDEKHRWSLGGVFRQGSKFRSRVERFAGSAIGRIVPPGFPPPSVGEVFQEDFTSLRVPDVYGIGAAFSGNDGNLKIAFDVDRVRYSQRLTDLVPLHREEYSLDDVNEIHLGLEKVFFTSDSLVGTFRLGVFNEPSHEPVFVGDDPDGRTFFPEGEEILHWSGGLGLVVREDFQIDAALDVSERAKTVSISLVRFF